MDLTEDSEGAMAPAKQKVSGVKGALSAQEVLNHLKKEKQNARAWWWSKFEPEINEKGACVVTPTGPTPLSPPGHCGPIYACQYTLYTSIYVVYTEYTVFRNPNIPYMPTLHIYSRHNRHRSVTAC